MGLGKIRIFGGFTVLLLLGGCTSPGIGQAVPQPGSVNGLVMAECRMFERAFVETKKQTGLKKYAIVQGCPGYEGKLVSGGGFLGAGFFLSSAGASVPKHVTARGTTAIRLYRRMIARGTPAKVAQKISNSPEFKVAVNVANQ